MALGLGFYSPGVLGGGDVMAYDQFDIRKDSSQTVFHQFRQGDTEPSIQLQVMSDEGVLDLTNFDDVFISWKSTDGITLKINGDAATFDNKSEGKVSFTPVATDTDVVEDYNIEFKFTNAGGDVLRVPNCLAHTYIARVNAQVNA